MHVSYVKPFGPKSDQKQYEFQQLKFNQLTPMLIQFRANKVCYDKSTSGKFLMSFQCHS